MLTDFIKEYLVIFSAILAAFLLLFALYLIFKWLKKVRPTSKNDDNNHSPITENNNDTIAGYSIEISDNSFNSNILSNQDNLSVSSHCNEVTCINIPLDAPLTNEPVALNLQDNSFNSNILSNQDNLSVSSHINEVTCINIPLDATLTNEPVALNWHEICVSVKNWIPYPTHLYHYTSIDNAREIVRDKVLRAFKPKVQIFPVGVYFTALSPLLNNRAIIMNNYIHYSKSYVKKVKCAIAIDMRELKFEKILDKNTTEMYGDIQMI